MTVVKELLAFKLVHYVKNSRQGHPSIKHTNEREEQPSKTAVKNSCQKQSPRNSSHKNYCYKSQTVNRHYLLERGGPGGPFRVIASLQLPTR